MVPDQLPDPIAVAVEFVSVLERLDIPYLIGGSVASSLHGEPRSTLDVDIVADLRLAHVEPLVTALERDYYIDADTVREAVRTAGSFNAIHLSSAVKVDVFVAGDDAFNAERLEQRERVEVWQDPPAVLFVDTAEHAVLRKLEWYRRGGEVSDRQWRDVLGILRVQGARLDHARLELWADRLAVSDLLRCALDEAGS